jgi:hypothetical protein
MTANPVAREAFSGSVGRSMYLAGGRVGMRLFEGMLRHLQLLPIRDYRVIEGWLAPKEALALYKLSRSCKPGARIVEIGSWKGKSTYCLAKGLRDGVIVAIDPFDGAGDCEAGTFYRVMKGNTPLLDQFRANLSRYDLLRKVEIKVGLSNQFANQIGPVDMLFIDGDHSIAGCEYDFRTFAPDVRVGGVLAFHDYKPRRSQLGPTWVVDNLVRTSKEWSFAGKWNSLVAFRRRSEKASPTAIFSDVR